MPSCWMDSALSGRTEKQAKKWQMRELMLLDTAERLIQEHGFAQFNMDSLVRACDVSKGTVYNHFSSREDCIAGLYIGCMESLLKLFTRAASFQGSPRE
ncbi:MAG: helix-turn-helix domain containing protein, partial [Oleibacter sp.]|nr:helix-turn-helix domain containing protein [Thalassolituus sp.]